MAMAKPLVFFAFGRAGGLGPHPTQVDGTWRSQRPLLLLLLLLLLMLLLLRPIPSYFDPFLAILKIAISLEKNLTMVMTGPS